jgi:hypothetical protein
MKKTKAFNKNLSLTKETVRSLTSEQLPRVAGGFVVPTDAGTGELTNTCNTACNAMSCQVCNN